MLIRTDIEFLSFLALDINILVNQSRISDITAVYVASCSKTGSNWIDLDRSKLSRTFHNIV